MGDDIDDLLDEVESKFCTSKKKTNVAKQAVCKSPQHRGTCSAADQPKVQRKKYILLYFLCPYQCVLSDVSVSEF